MRKFLQYTLLFSVIFLFISCGKTETEEDLVATVIEGSWVKEGVQASSKLIFNGNTFEVKSGTSTLYGTFELADKNTFKGKLTGILGAVSNTVTPVQFLGSYSITDEKVTFSDFQGKWNTIFIGEFVKSTN